MSTPRAPLPGYAIGERRAAGSLHLAACFSGCDDTDMRSISTTVGIALFLGCSGSDAPPGVDGAADGLADQSPSDSGTDQPDSDGVKGDSADAPDGSDSDLPERGWHRFEVPKEPTLDSNVAVAVDTLRKRLVAFGPSIKGAPNVELWELDPADPVWTNRTPSPVPSTWPAWRAEASMACNPTADECLLFGGDGIASPGPYELWRWTPSKNTWTNVTALPGPNPPGRHGAFLGFAPSGAAVLFGGVVGMGIDDPELWEWDGSAWKNHTPKAPPPGSWPNKAAYPVATIVPSKGRLLHLGPEGVGTLWSLDLSSWSWTNLTPTPRPASWPAGKYWATSGYDDAKSQLIVYSGTSIEGPPLLVWDESSGGDWSTRTFTPSPKSTMCRNGGFMPWRGSLAIWRSDTDGYTWEVVP